MTVEENILKKANQKRLLGDLAIEGGNFTTAYFKSVSGNSSSECCCHYYCYYYYYSPIYITRCCIPKLYAGKSVHFWDKPPTS
jgi:hypothetical protein